MFARVVPKHRMFFLTPSLMKIKGCEGGVDWMQNSVKIVIYYKFVLQYPFVFQLLLLCRQQLYLFCAFRSLTIGRVGVTVRNTTKILRYLVPNFQLVLLLLSLVSDPLLINVFCINYFITIGFIRLLRIEKRVKLFFFTSSDGRE